MCGIIFGTRRDNRPVKKSILKRYENQKGRGTDGFGYLVVKNDKVQPVERSKYEFDIKKELEKEDSDTILFHHRWPTSTDNLEEVTHPIVVVNEQLKYNYYLVHNGVIGNCDDLKKEHEKKGFEYTTEILTNEITTIGGNLISEFAKKAFNDSESLAIELALVLDGKKDKVETEGGVAFVCIQTDKKDKIINLFYGRNGGNPLVVEDNGVLFFLKSIGAGKEIEEDVLYTMNYETKIITTKDLKIGKERMGFNVTEWNKSHRHRNNVRYNTRNSSSYNLKNRTDLEEHQDDPHNWIQELSDSQNLLNSGDRAIRNMIKCDNERTSQDRMSLIEEKIILLNADIDIGEAEFAKHHNKATDFRLSASDFFFFGELVKECTEKKEQYETELDWIKDFNNEDYSDHLNIPIIRM